MNQGGKWRSQDTVYRKFLNFCEAYFKILENIVHDVYQSGDTKFSNKGLVRNTTKQILSKIKLNYSVP